MARPAATSNSGAGTGVRRASPATAALPATSNSSGNTSIVFRPPSFSRDMPHARRNLAIMKQCTHADESADRTRTAERDVPAVPGRRTHPVQLRLCLSCGHLGCCDSSPLRHATEHFKETGHPVMRTFEPGELALVLRRPRTGVTHGPDGSTV